MRSILDETDMVIREMLKSVNQENLLGEGAGHKPAQEVSNH